MSRKPLFYSFRQYLVQLLFNANRVTSFVIECGQHPARFEEGPVPQRVYHVLQSALVEGWLDELVALILAQYPKSQLGRWLADKPQIVAQMEAEANTLDQQNSDPSNSGLTIDTIKSGRDVYVATNQIIYQVLDSKPLPAALPSSSPFPEALTISPLAPSEPLSEAERLAQLLANPRLPVHERLAAGEQLGQLGDPRFGVTTRELEMIEFAGNWFVIGELSAQDEYSNEHTPSAVRVRPFGLSRYQLTNAQYARFLAAQGGQYDPAAPWWADADGAARAWS